MSAVLEKRPSHEVVSASTEEHHNTTARLGSLDDVDALATLGYRPELQRNRSMATLLFQSLAIAAIPFGVGGPLTSAIYGGGQLSIFVGWIVILILSECVAVSLGELASRYPTSAGPYYWSFQIATNGKAALSYLTGWTWLIGNWTITLSVNFGLASLIAGTVAMYHPDWTATDWELLLIFYAICIVTFIICAVGNRFLPMVDTICAAWTALSIIVICIALSVKAEAGRHSASYALGHYDTSLSGWGGFTFFIGLLPAAYTFSGIGMISSMAEECADPTTTVPWAITLCIPVGGLAGFFFILPICFTMPPLEDIILAPYGQALPYIFQAVMGSPGGGLGLTFSRSCNHDILQHQYHGRCIPMHLGFRQRRRHPRSQDLFARPPYPRRSLVGARVDDSRANAPRPDLPGQQLRLPSVCLGRSPSAGGKLCHPDHCQSHASPPGGEQRKVDSRSVGRYDCERHCCALDCLPGRVVQHADRSACDRGYDELCQRRARWFPGFGRGLVHCPREKVYADF